MSQIPYIFNQLVAHIPKDTFDRLVKQCNGNAYVKSFSCWSHLLVMVWAQLTSRRSLRDIETSLRAHSDKLYRMGIGTGVSRNNLASANARRDVSIYRELAQRMMRKASGVGIKDGTLELIRRRFCLNGFFAIDSSTITLDLHKFPWSAPQQECGGVKFHTMFDLLRGVPRSCIVTGHEERDQTFMEDYAYERGCFYIFDKMYFKTRGLFRVEDSGAYFVTRIKRNAVYRVTENRPVSGTLVLADKTIEFTSRWAKAGYPKPMRKISFYSKEKAEVLEFVTNNFELEAATIALLYKYRWQVELFFRWVKQHLKINSFYGTSANAVMMQIYIAISCFCLLAIAADSVKFKGSLYEFANLMSVSLTERRWLDDLVNGYCPQKPSDKPVQLSIFDSDILLQLECE